MKRKMVEGTSVIVYSKLLIWSIILSGIIGGCILYFGKNNKFIKDLINIEEESI